MLLGKIIALVFSQFYTDAKIYGDLSPNTTVFAVLVIGLETELFPSSIHIV